MAYPVEPLADLAEEGQLVLAVSIVQIDGFPPVTTGHNFVQSANQFNLQGSGHQCKKQSKSSP